MNETEQIPSRSIRKIALTLETLGVKFAFVGGVAVALVATPRFTADVDAVLLGMDDHLEWLVEQLEASGYTTRSRNQIDMTRRTRVLTLLDQTGIGIDLMIGLLPFDEDLVRFAISAQLEGGVSVPVASPEYLLVMKAVAWRPKDLQDIREIIAVNPGYDRGFVIKTFTEFAELLEVPERVAQLESMFDRESGPI